MRIAYLIHQYLPDHIGGTETYVHSLAKRCASSGHDVLIVTHREVGPKAPQYETFRRVFDGAPVVEIGSNLSRARNIAEAEYSDQEMRSRIREILQDWKPDVVHAGHLMRLTIGALEACRDLDIPVVVSLTDYWPLCPAATLLMSDGRLCPGPMQRSEQLRCAQELHAIGSGLSSRRAVRKRPERVRGALLGTDGLIAFTPFVKEMYVRNGFPPSHIAVVPLGLEPDTLRGFEGRSTLGQSTRLLFIGSLVPHKGLHLVLDGLAMVPDVPVTLDVYGAVTDTPYVHDLVAKARSDTRIRFKGTFPEDQLGKVFSGADYLVVPSIWYEGGPLVARAAVELGVPVVTHRLGSRAEMIDEHDNGFFVEPTVDDWAKAIQIAHERRDDWSRVGKQLGSMDDHFSWVLARYEALAAR